MIQETQHFQKVIWVIDDDETALMLAEDVLAGAGFKVRTFLDAATALAAAPAGLPDLVVVDVIMPGINGYEFCSRLRQLPRGALIPILVTTSLDDNASINQAYQAGATNFATKPINWTIEVQRLHYLLKSADLARELQQKEQETRMAKEDWERTFDSINDSVMVLDTNRTVLRANTATAKLLGLSVESILGRHCYELFHRTSQPCSECPATCTEASGLPVSAEVKCGPANNLFEITISPVTDDRQKVTHLVHVMRDLSERKRLEAELRQAQKMEAVGTLAGGIAHDFNNILMVIQCYTETLKTNADLPDGDSQVILEAIRRGAALAKQLLVFSRKGAAVSLKQPVNLNERIRNVIRMIEKGLPKTVSLHPCLPHHLQPALANPEQIEQVLMNLAVNAAHAMPTGGELSFETRNFTPAPDFLRLHPKLKPGDYVRITVSDTGHGMDRQTMERIYEPFFTTKKAGEGTGLGLSVVFGIIQDHAGLITCESEVGLGTTFTVYLPAAGQPESQPRSATAEPPPSPRGSETIMVVDDEMPICNLVKRYLTKLGYTVITAQDGEMALEKYTAAGRRPHAVVLDLDMPKMHGWKCLEKLRQLNPQVKVLIATGYGGDNLEPEARNRGAAGLLPKPYLMADLCRALRNILDTDAPAS